MGNCSAKQETKKIQAEITTPVIHPHHIQFPRKKPPSPPLLFLFGDPNSSATNYLRFVLLYKPLTLRFVPTDSPEVKVRFETEDDPFVGPTQMILEHVEEKLPLPPLMRRDKKKLLEWLGDDETTASWEVVEMAVLHHRSMKWHLERVARWGMDLATRGGLGGLDPSVGTPKMEVTKFGKSYGNLLEILLEHAQMEERLLFPILQLNDPGICRCVNEEHARDLPVMNGIKEDIKSVGVLNAGTATHQEAFHSLSARLKSLQENCNQHFDEEERNLFPLMEAANLSRNQQRKIVKQCVDVMQATHSHLFCFFIEGLLPHEALEYLDLIGSCIDKEKMASLLHSLVES